MARTGTVKRESFETKVSATVEIDGSGRNNIKTGIGFFDHMLDLLSSHGRFDIDISCIGDLQVDGHHSVEDIGIVLGRAFKKALGQRMGINRYGNMTLPMDETLAEVSLDISGRPYLHLEMPALTQFVGDFDTQLLEEFLRSFSNHLGLTLHVRVAYGRNTHHIIEGIFKALGRALRQAVAVDSTLADRDVIPSTKGILD
ncbi:MAG TPA: imidazoleglycerol-phosphate dehydratase HisB [Clostridia bacterium]|nr:imidazoleglycerol-phosphate dehydratase HisB [Clostridia bacterium]